MATAIACALALATAEQAAAQAQPVPTFAGGWFPRADVTRAPFTGHVGFVAQVVQPGRVTLRFETAVRCPSGNVYDGTGRKTVGWDGATLAARGATTYRVGRNRLDYAWELATKVQGDTMFGVLRITGTERRPGKRASRCTELPSRPILARLTADPGTTPVMNPSPRAFYAGLIDARVGAVPGVVQLRMADPPTRLGARWTVRLRCDRGPSFVVTNSTSPTTIVGDGSFTQDERFVVRLTGGAVRYRAQFNGRFLAGGGAAGRLRVTTAAFDRRTGRLVRRCDSGEVPWAAREVLTPELG
ncbi:hypothetical protein [Conexibacter sp. SYSU D00693]|uniref:hypothetical protein n=1 Tax=Conexibacter sp. SYSU D00693 TaxID=2812560 RepID=UPI00196B9CDF|nr:hypothetical protein [Conexibacter sp. SYSU D00693]